MHLCTIEFCRVVVIVEDIVFFGGVSYLCKFIVCFKGNSSRLIPNGVTLFYLDGLVFVFVEASA